MGYTRFQRVIRVELPIAVPVIAAGLRVASVANVSMVAIAGTIGVANLGQLFTNGFQLSTSGPYYPPIALGIVLCVALALVVRRGHRARQPGGDPVAAGGGGAMNSISLSATWTWLDDPLNWRANSLGPGIPAQILEPPAVLVHRAGDRRRDRRRRSAWSSATAAGAAGWCPRRTVCERCPPPAC